MNIAMDLMRPISPQQARERTVAGVSAALIAVVNQLIVEALVDDKASLDLAAIAKRYLSTYPPDPRLRFDRNVLQPLAAVYRERGWHVTVTEVTIDQSDYSVELLFVMPPDTRKPPSKAKKFAVRALTIGVVALYVYLMWEFVAAMLPIR